MLWLIWGLSTIVAVGCGLWLTRRWRPLWLRETVRALAVVTLVVPAASGGAGGHYAPAYLVLFFEALLQDAGDPVPAIVNLSVAWAVALVVVVIVSLRRRRA